MSASANQTPLLEPAEHVFGEGQLQRHLRSGRYPIGMENPYPHDFPGRVRIGEVLAAHDPVGLEHGEHPEFRYRVAGRLISRRGHGKTIFLELQDGSGSIQGVVIRDAVSDAAFEALQAFDIGDIVGVDGCLYVTQRGQLAVSVGEGWLLAKALLPPPAKHGGLEDLESRYRHRELDLMANESTRDLFVTRSRTVSAIREWLSTEGFIEIEAPVMQALAGGANARPFVTHHNALERDLSLTVSGELHLKRCLVGGLDRVYALGRCFRNEGISHKHSPEFTLLEWEKAYDDYRGVQRDVEALIVGVAEQVLDATKIEQHDGQVIDLGAPWQRVSVHGVIAERLGIDIDAATWEELTFPFGQVIPEDVGWGQVVCGLYSHLIEPQLIAPTIVYDFPLEFSPIVKRHRTDPRLIEHFELVIRGMEIGCGDSELNDPIEQRQRFIDQRHRRRLDEGEEAHPADEEFVHAMEYGMPPAGGAGIGIDRLLAIYTGAETLRQVIPFPTLRGIS
jgi:lysyl-tRNA synthetase, class II